MAKEKPAPGFEESLKELEAIVSRMERGEVPLEEAIADYQRGADLVTRCRELLNDAKQKIERISAKSLAADGTATGDAPGS